MWIKTKALFANELAELGIDKELEQEDFYFDLTQVVAFNRSENPQYSCIWIKGGHGTITITISFEQLEEIMKP
jgi:hypothetical protein